MRNDDQATREFSIQIDREPSTLVEDFLADSPTIVVTDVRELILIEMQSRVHAGEVLNPGEYQSRFPELTDEIPEMVSSVNANRLSTLEASQANPTVFADPSQSLQDTNTGASDASAEYSVTQSFSPPTVAQEQSAAKPTVSRLGDHELLEVIGRGGMGIVYRARNVKLQREVAIKTITTGREGDAQLNQRFRRESEAVARLDHPGIASVYESGEQDGIAWFSMALVKGESLQAILKQGTLVPRDAVEVIRKLADAIQYAHESGVIHRDLKPGNVLLDHQGEPKLVDFGLARMADRDSMTNTGATIGTPSYMAPEQIRGGGEIGPSADVYGLGAILYTCLAGRPPFRGQSTMATLNLVLYAQPTPLRQLQSTVPRDLEIICEKCLAKQAQDRYASAAELSEELQRFLSGRPIAARPVPVWTRVYRWGRRNPAIAALLATTFGVLVAATLVSVNFALVADQKAASAVASTKKANLATDRAKDAAAVARKQSRLALKSLQTIIYTVQGKLRGIPEAREVRRELLKVALEDLQSISEAYVEQSTIDRDSALALADLAELYTQLGDEAGGDTQQVASQHFRKSADIYLELVKLHPEDYGLISTTCKLLMDWGDIAREYRRFEEAIEAHRKGRELAVNWHSREPDDLKAQLAYFRSSESLGEALLRVGKHDECRDFILKAAELADAYCVAVNDANAWDNVNRCYCTLGDMHRIVGEPEPARIAYERMCQATEMMMALDPGDPQWPNDQCADFERLGDLEMSIGNLDKAREHFEQSLKYAIEYVDGDPTNHYRLQESTWSYSKLANVCRAQGDTERASWLQAELARIKNTLKGEEE